MADNKKIVYFEDSVIEIRPSKEIGFDWKVEGLSGSAFTQEGAEQAAKEELKASASS